MPREIELDVCHYHAEGREPFGDIMAAAAHLGPGDSLRLINTFEPVPLYGIMNAEGFAQEARQEGESRWVITFTKATAPAGAGRS